jgi:hypothetical protein
MLQFSSAISVRRKGTYRVAQRAPAPYAVAVADSARGHASVADGPSLVALHLAYPELAFSARAAEGKGSRDVTTYLHVRQPDLELTRRADDVSGVATGFRVILRGPRAVQ